MEVFVALVVGILLLLSWYRLSTSDYRRRVREARILRKQRLARRRELIEKLEREMPDHVRERRARAASRSQ